jgi:hypothetical protein
MELQTREYLNNLYENEIDELEALLELDFGSWKNA